MDLVKSFDGILEWHDGDVAFHYKRKKNRNKILGIDKMKY